MPADFLHFAASYSIVDIVKSEYNVRMPDCCLDVYMNKHLPLLDAVMDRAPDIDNTNNITRLQAVGTFISVLVSIATQLKLVARRIIISY